jgi:hypothetical protein
MQDYRASIRSANRSNEAAYHDSRPLFLPLFTNVVEEEFCEVRLSRLLASQPHHDPSPMCVVTHVDFLICVRYRTTKLPAPSNLSILAH